MYNSSKLRKPEDDVLYKKIPGTGLIAIMKRFYRNLFMLSYTDQRSRHYLVTFQAMAKERARHYRWYPGTIHPFSIFRCFWEYFMICVCITKTLTIGYNTSIFMNEVVYAMWYSAFLSEFFIIVDLFVSIKTGYVSENSKEIILDPKLILTKFLSTKVCLYVMGSIPLHGLMYLRNGLSHRDCTFCNSSLFVTTMRLFGILSIPRYYDATVFLEREESPHFIRTACRRFVRITVLAFMTFYWIWCMHHCVYMLNVIMHNKVEDNECAQLLVAWYEMKSSGRPNFAYLLLNDLTHYAVLHSLDVDREMDVLQKFTVIVGFLAANVFYLWFFMVAFDITFQVLFKEDRLMKQVNRVENMFINRQLPDMLTKKVKSYYRFAEVEGSNIEEANSFYAAMPISLKKEVALHCYRRHLSRIPIFSELLTPILNEIVLLLRQEIFMAGDVVSQKRIKADGLIIVDKGVAAVYAETGEELEHLIDGDYFDLLSLFSDEEFRVNTVIAVLNTKVNENGVVYLTLCDDQYSSFMELVCDGPEDRLFKKHLQRTELSWLDRLGSKGMKDEECMVYATDIKSSILFLDKHCFRRLMTNYPDQFFRLRQKLRKARKPRHLHKNV